MLGGSSIDGNYQPACNLIRQKRQEWGKTQQAPASYVHTQGAKRLAREFQSTIGYDVAWFRTYVCPYLDSPAELEGLRVALVGLAVEEVSWTSAVGVILGAFVLICHPPKSKWGWIKTGLLVAAGGALVWVIRRKR